MADDTIDTFNGSDLSKTRDATLSVIITTNLQDRLVPELVLLAEILNDEAAQAKENGEYTFYDEFLSIQKCVEFGTFHSPGSHRIMRSSRTALLAVPSFAFRMRSMLMPRCRAMCLDA